MNPIRCVLVDDERLARNLMRKLLSAYADFQVVAEAANIGTAAQVVRQQHPDVLFLDIQMPGGDGFELLRQLLPHPPHTVFITAYDRHALRAFEVNALDYLLKPVAPERFALAIARLRERVQPGALPPAPPAELPNLQADDRILIPAGHSGFFVCVREILHVTALRNYSAVQLQDGQRLAVRQTLAAWSKRLPPEVFVPLDRSCLVHWPKIQRSEVTSRGAKLHFGGPGLELELGRTAAQRFRELLAKSGS